MKKTLSAIHCDFSLIELLVVISLFAVLASLVTPSLKSMIKQTHLLNCKSIINNISNTIALYNSDENEHYTPNVKIPLPYTQANAEKYTWDDFLAVYDGREASKSWLSGWGVFNKNNTIPDWHQYNCPSNPLPRIMDAFAGSALAIRRDYEVTRGQATVPPSGIKSLVGIAGDDNWSAQTTDVTSPASTFILTERIGPRFIGYPFSSGMAKPSEQTSTGDPLHDRDHFNYLFADGHIDYLNHLDTIKDAAGKVLPIQNTAWNYQRN